MCIHDIFRGEIDNRKRDRVKEEKEEEQEEQKRDNRMRKMLHKVQTKPN